MKPVVGFNRCRGGGRPGSSASTTSPLPTMGPQRKELGRGAYDFEIAVDALHGFVGEGGGVAARRAKLRASMMRRSGAAKRMRFCRILRPSVGTDTSLHNTFTLPASLARVAQASRPRHGERRSSSIVISYLPRLRG